MSQTSPLYALTPNVKTQITVTAQANRIRVVNDSSLYLRVYFGADAPIQATDPGWHDTISPGDKPLLWITGGTGQAWWAQSGNASSTPFTGVITFLPFFPIGATIAGGGVISGSSILYITAFSPDENAERGGQTEAFVQAAKQGRFQSVDGGIPPLFDADILTTEAYPTGIPATFQGARVANLNPTVAPNLYAANAAVGAGTVPIQCYLYAFYAKLRAKTPAVVSALFSPTLKTYDSTGVTSHGSTVLMPGGTILLQAVNYGVDTYIMEPSKPLNVPVGVTNHQLASGDIIWLGLNVGFTFAGDFDLEIRAILGVDLVNVMPLTAIAGFNQLIGSTNPVLAPSPFNPETY